ncbi:hypothetical protein EV05_1614 [Prochlorococcus sp. MIT 0601]|nr:hypothetical protein EV05_1614 [Prochlorococcus sp. MIT 0601]
MVLVSKLINLASIYIVTSFGMADLSQLFVKLTDLEQIIKANATA